LLFAQIVLFAKGKVKLLARRSRGGKVQKMVTARSGGQIVHDAIRRCLRPEKRIGGLLTFFVSISTLTILNLLSACNSRPSSQSAAVAPALQRSLAVTRFSTSDLDDAAADHALGLASQIISNNSCDLSLTRSGPVSQFNTGTGIIVTKTDYLNVCAQPGYVHVVNQINSCDGTTDALGCSDISGKCMVLVRWTPDATMDPSQMEEGILWAHEYGHTKGLQHREDSDAVMNSVLGPDHLKVISCECSAYLERGSCPAAAVEPARQAAGVEGFVHQIYIHGVPAQQARQYNSPEDVKKLAEFLQNPKEQVYWSNAVMTLGLIGTPNASQELASFLNRGSGVLTPAAYRAKSSAVIAMGYALARSGGEPLLTFLERKTDPKAWQSLSWSSPFTSDPDQERMQLARSAVAALGVSGNAKAAAALEGIQRKSTSVGSGKPQFYESLRDALNENHDVQKVGFDAYVIKNEQTRNRGETNELPK
jgi:hypothetical protein